MNRLVIVERRKLYRIESQVRFLFWWRTTHVTTWMDSLNLVASTLVGMLTAARGGKKVQRAERRRLARNVGRIAENAWK